MAFPKKFASKKPAAQTDKRYQNIGAVWNRTSKKDGSEYQTADFAVTDKEGNVVGEILFLDYETKQYYRLKSAGARVPKTENPNAPIFSLSVDLNNPYQVEKLEEEVSSSPQDES